MAEAQNKTARVWKASKNAVAGVQTTETFAALIGDKRNFVLVDNKGIYLRGPISIIADAANIRRGGLWVGISDFIHMIPSTLFTPFPAQIPFPPIFAVTDIKDDVAYFQAFLV